MKVLVVGQIPPPYGGQAVMIGNMLSHKFPGVTFIHVRMSFSSNMAAMGQFGFWKVLHLIGLVLRIWYMWLWHKPETLYYPPAGPSFTPMLRDIIILCATRWMFRKTIFHFHAAGISIMHSKLPRFLKPFFWYAYRFPDLAIRTSLYNPDDGQFFQAKARCVVPNGIQDEYWSAKSKLAACVGFHSDSFRSGTGLLYVGLISRSKGIMTLVDAIEILARRNEKVTVSIVGDFESDVFREILEARIWHAGLQDVIRFKGVLTGLNKSRQFLLADVFCFPTHFESESFGLVALEAMQFGLPIVASRWRGVQSLVEDGYNGYLVPIHDGAVLAERISQLISDQCLRAQMGSRGRQRYLSDFTQDRCFDRLARCFAQLA